MRFIQWTGGEFGAQAGSIICGGHLPSDLFSGLLVNLVRRHDLLSVVEIYHQIYTVDMW